MLFPCGIATITGVVLANFNESRGSWYFMIAAMGILAAILLAVRGTFYRRGLQSFAKRPRLELWMEVWTGGGC